MKRVHLWDLCGAALVVPAKTGVVYTNQAGGTACLQPELEGILIHISNDYLPSRFTESLEYHLCSLFTGYEEFDSAKAVQLQTILSSFASTMGIHVNMSRLSESNESWVHVVLHDTQHSCYSGFEGVEAIFTWPNSD